MVLATPVLAVTLGLIALERLAGSRRFRSSPGWRPAALSAPVLVLFAPGRLHHDPAGHGRGQRDDHLFLSQAAFRLQVRRLREPRHRHLRLHRLGPPHVRHQPVDLRGDGVFHLEFPRVRAVGHQGLQLDGYPVQRPHHLPHADALRARLHRAVHHRGFERIVPRHYGRGHARARHLLRHRAFSLHHGWRHGHGVSRRHPLLVAQDQRTHVQRETRAVLGGGHLHRLQPDLPAAVRAGWIGHATALSRRTRRSGRCSMCFRRQELRCWRSATCSRSVT